MSVTKYSSPCVICSNNVPIPAHENFGRFMLDHFLKNANKIALIDGNTGVEKTYGELAQQAMDIAAALIQSGIGADDVIGICSENRPEFISTTVGGICAGAVVAFINCAYSKDEIIHTLSISKPKYVFLSPNTFELYYETIQKMDFIKKFFVFGNIKTSEVNGKLMSFNDFASKRVDVHSFQHKYFNGAEKTAVILYSSGTTGLPKGAKLSHKNLIISAQNCFRDLKRLATLSIAPWTNTIGFILTIIMLVYGETVVYMTRYSEETYFQCIEKYQVGILLAVPPLVVMLGQSQLLSKFNVSSVEIIICGGAPLNSYAIDNAKKRLPNLRNVLQGYGMTEASGAITSESELAHRQGSVGRICDGLTIKIVDEESRELLGPYKTGELCLKGPVLFQGYIGKKYEETFDAEGYYNTGDIAYYDEDGYFFIVDRIKELIKFKAWQVAPSELEAILHEHPGVSDTGVVGAPDDLAGELPTAFVVKKPGATVTETELMEFVKLKVSPWKQIRGGVRFVKEIPKNPSGKILRRKLREILSKPKSKL